MWSSVFRNPPRSCDPSGFLPASWNRRSSSSPSRMPTIATTTRRAWTCADGKSHFAPGWSRATPRPSTLPDSVTSISPRRRQSLVHEPPTWYVCVVRLVIVIDQRTRSDVRRARARTLTGEARFAHVRLERVRRECIRNERTDTGARQEDHSPQERLLPSAHGRHHLAATRVCRYRPSPVINARSVSPKLMKETHANGTHRWIGRSMPIARAVPSLATTCANTKSSNGR